MLRFQLPQFIVLKGLNSHTLSLWFISFQLLEIRTGNVHGFDLSPINKYRWNAHYEPVDLSTTVHTKLSDVVRVFEFDFTAPVEENREQLLTFRIKQLGICNAVAFWFELHLDSETVISTAPGSCWRQALQYLSSEMHFAQLDEELQLKALHNSTKIWFLQLGKNAPSPTDIEEEVSHEKRLARLLEYRNSLVAKKVALSRIQFDLLLDKLRNEAYAVALTAALRRKPNARVMDIGELHFNCSSSQKLKVLALQERDQASSH
jgi:hypothetical protein